MSLLGDARSIRDKDPAARGTLEVILLYAGFHAIVWHRISNFFWRHKLKLIARLTSQLGRFFTGVEIHPAAKIGSGLLIDHGMGVVIGETAEIGNNCTIYHGVTLGGTGKDVGKRHPTIGNNVLIGAGAKVLGPFKVGDNSMIGANSVVLKEIEPNTTVVGIPGRIVKKQTEKVASEDLDQINLPDLNMQEINKLQTDLAQLEASLRSISSELVQLKTNCPSAKKDGANEIS